jgi:rhodanese-related sulfurtransferase
MKPINKLLVTSFLVITLVLSGCVQEEETKNGGSTSEQMSFTTVLISDAPSDNFSHINVTFSQVKIHKYGNDNDSGWIIFDMEPKTIDMIYLHENNLSEELGVKNISVGNYSNLWIVVNSATGVLKETGEEITFDVPSGDLKIQQSFEIQEGNTTIDVELDLGRSVLYVPQGGVYTLIPQLVKMEINYDEGKDDDKESEIQILNDISVEEANVLIQNNVENNDFIIIDIRTPEEFESGHIEKSIMIDYYSNTYKDDLDKLDKSKTYLIYCRTGRRTGLTLDLMEELGFSEVYNMLGGITQWQAEGYTII